MSGQDSPGLSRTPNQVSLDEQALTVRLMEGHGDVPVVVVAGCVHIAAVGLAAALGRPPTDAEVERLAVKRLGDWRRAHPRSA